MLDRILSFIADMLSQFKQSRKQLVKFVHVESSSTSFTKDSAKSIDLSIANQAGYTFLTWINPRGIGVAGSFYITIMNQSQCRIWSVPAGTVNAKVGATAVFVKNEYA